MSAVIDFINNALPNNGDTGGVLGIATGSPFAGKDTGIVDMLGSPATAGTDLQPYARLGGIAALGGALGGVEGAGLDGGGAGLEGGFGGDFSDINSFSGPGFGETASGLGTGSEVAGLEGGSFAPPAGWDNFATTSSGATPTTGNYLNDLMNKLKALKQGPLGTAYNLGSGAYGLYQSYQAQQLAKRASTASDPFADSRRIANSQYQSLASNPSNMESDPAWQAMIQAITRKAASQGYLGSGNMLTALAKGSGDWLNSRLTSLAGIAGSGFNPAGAGQLAITGNTGALQLQGNALNRVGLGLKGLETP